MPRAFTDAERERITTRLLDAAQQATAGRGLRRTSIDALTRKAGISKGAFYPFFENKEALAIALLKRGESELRADLDRAAQGPDPLRSLLTTLFHSVRVHPMLALLRDPEELAWLTRSVPESLLDDEKRGDVEWFDGLLCRLRGRGVVVQLTGQQLRGLAGAAMALAQGEGLVEPDVEGTIGLMVEGLVALLGPV